MPGAAFHSFYWSGAGDAPAPPDPPLGASASGGYVPWQTTITTSLGLLLICQPQWQPCR